MRMEEACRKFNIQVTEQQLASARWIEAKGFIFACHFGVENVIQLATEVLTLECQKDIERGLIN
jgi:hypothetical protein